MNISLPFEIGQEVYIIETISTEELIPCEVCDSMGFVLIKDIKYSCPNCGEGAKLDTYNRGTGKIKKYDTKWIKSKPYKITGINIRYTIYGSTKIVYFIKKDNLPNEYRFTPDRLYSAKEIDKVIEKNNKEIPISSEKSFQELNEIYDKYKIRRTYKKND